MKETEIAKHFIKYLSDYDLYFEIPYTHTDIVAKDGNILMAFEVKNSLNFKVIEQSARWRWNFHYSYICVPYSKNMNFAIEICKMFGIGILTANIKGGMLWGDIWEELKPKFNRSAFTKHIILPEYCKRSIPGASGNEGTTITIFKITIENIVKYIQRHPEPTVKEVFDNIDHHYSSFSAARNSMYTWIRKGIIKEFYIDKGKFYLREVVNQL